MTRLFFFIIFVSVLTGCGGAKRRFTEEELKQIIVPGMSASALKEQVGKPNYVMDLEKGEEIWTYRYRESYGERDYHMVGFSVTLRENKVTDWGRIMGESKSTSLPKLHSTGVRPFRVYVATDELKPAVKAFDEEGKTTVDGWREADLVFNATVFLGRDPARAPNALVLELKLEPGDVSKLGDLMAANFGKRLLFVTGGNVVAAPVITAPVRTSWMTISTQESVVKWLGDGR